LCKPEKERIQPRNTRKARKLIGKQISFVLFVSFVVPKSFNAGAEGSIVVENIKNSGKMGYGYNVITGEYADMTPAVSSTPPKSPAVPCSTRHP